MILNIMKDKILDGLNIILNLIVYLKKYHTKRFYDLNIYS